MARRKSEAVTVSFHYLVREKKGDDGEIKITPFSQGEFDHLVNTILALKPLDLTDENVKDRLRFKSIAPLESPSRLDGRTLFGAYRAAYWGHAYDNTERGKIPADSLSLRPFYYLLYLSESGRIYIATQYLGNFGGYTALKTTLVRFLANSKNVAAHSFRLDGAAYKDIHPKEVKVTVARKGSALASGNSFSDSAVIAFRKQGRKDVAFELDVKNKLLPHLGKSKADVREAVAAIMNDNSLIDVNDEDIADCTIIADVNGKQKNIYMIEQGSFASQLGIDVSYNIDGHPEMEPTKKAMLSLLADHIIARGEDV